MKNKTIVVGCGRLGANIAHHFGKLGHSVDIIDLDADAFRKIPDDFSGNNIVGDATDLTVLDMVDLADANRLVVVTGDDNYNIYIAKLALEFYHVEKIFIRLYDTYKGELIKDSPIKAIYPFNLSMDAFYKIEGDNES